MKKISRLANCSASPGFTGAALDSPHRLAMMMMFGFEVGSCLD